MKVYTSRYQNQKQIIDSGLVPVGITRGQPRFKLNYRKVDLKLLAPTDYVFTLKVKQEYERHYREYLNTIGVSRIKSEMEAISQAHGHADLVLLCFEDVYKPGEWCHRRMFAEWWESKTGMAIPELPPTCSQQSLGIPDIA